MQFLGIAGPAGSGKDSAADYIVKTYGGEKIALADPMKFFLEDVFGFTNRQLWGPSQFRNAPDKRYEGSMRPGALHVARTRFEEHAPSWLLGVLPHFTHAQRVASAEALRLWFEDFAGQASLTPRYGLQTLGTEWGRAQDPSIWLLYAERDAKARELKGYVLISDCRFLNEAKFLRERDAKLLEIIRPGTDGSAAMAAGVAAHPSEMERVRHQAEFKTYVTHTITNDDTLETFYRRLSEALVGGQHGAFQDHRT